MKLIQQKGFPALIQLLMGIFFQRQMGKDKFSCSKHLFAFSVSPLCSCLGSKSASVIFQIKFSCPFFQFTDIFGKFFKKVICTGKFYFRSKFPILFSIPHFQHLVGWTASAIPHAEKT